MRDISADIGIIGFHAATLGSREFAPDRWTLPKIEKAGQLAEWLGLSIGELD